MAEKTPKENIDLNDSEAIISYAKTLFKAADKLRKNIDAAEYKHPVLGLIFLKYISDSFEERYNELVELKSQGADPDDKDEYLAEKIFWVPEESRWSHIQNFAKNPKIGKIIDDAMIALERENKSLKGVLPKDYARPKLDKASLGSLVDLFSDIPIGGKENQSRDVLGRIYEYFLGQFASKEGKKGGQFYTPSSVVRLLVEIIRPIKGRFYEPCAGSGGMIIQSERMIDDNKQLIFYGQESNETTWRLCKMNLAIRAIDADIKWNNEGTFLKDEHPNLKADYVLANPPFNDDEWYNESLNNDPRWIYGKPPKGNGNYAWIQHFISHLSDNGVAGFVLANGSLSSKPGSEEDKIRRKLIENDLVECIIRLPTKLFFSTQISASLWFIRKNKKVRKNETLFIDARSSGFLPLGEKIHKELPENDRQFLSNIYHSWLGIKNPVDYNDIPGICYSATKKEIEEHNFALVPGRYTGVEEIDDDDEDFYSTIKELFKQLDDELKTSSNLDDMIRRNFKSILK